MSEAQNLNDERILELLNTYSEDEMIEKVILPLYKKRFKGKFYSIEFTGKDKREDGGVDITYYEIKPDTKAKRYSGVQVKQGAINTGKGANGFLQRQRLRSTHGSHRAAPLHMQRPAHGFGCRQAGVAPELRRRVCPWQGCSFWDLRSRRWPPIKGCFATPRSFIKLFMTTVRICIDLSGRLFVGRVVSYTSK